MKLIFLLLFAAQAAHAAPIVDYGFAAKQGQFPNVVKLSPIQDHAFFGLQELSSCTGTLIAPTIILTAAHCIRSFPDSNLYASWAGDIEGKLIEKNKIKGIAAKSFYVSTQYQKLLPKLKALNERVGGSEYIRMSPYERDQLHQEIHVRSMELSKFDIALVELTEPQSLTKQQYARIQCKQGLKVKDQIMFAGYGVNRIPGTLNANGKGVLHWGKNSISELQQKSLYIVSNSQEKQLINSGDSGGPLFKAGNAQSIYGINVLKQTDENGNSIGGIHNALNSVQSRSFFLEVSKNRALSLALRQSIQSCL